MDEYDTILSEMLTEMQVLLDSGLDPIRRGEEFSDEERFIILSRRVNEMARSRPDTRPIRRTVNGRAQVISMRDVVMAERKERHEKEAPLRSERAARLAAKGK